MRLPSPFREAKNAHGGLYLAVAVGPLAILPMVAYHAAQLVIDTLLADWWRNRGRQHIPSTRSLTRLTHRKFKLRRIGSVFPELSACTQWTCQRAQKVYT